MIVLIRSFDDRSIIDRVPGGCLAEVGRICGSAKHADVVIFVVFISLYTFEENTFAVAGV